MEYYSQAIDLVKSTFGGSGGAKVEEQVTTTTTTATTTAKSPKTLKSMIGSVKETIENDAEKNKSQRLNEGGSVKKLKKVSDRKTPFSGGFYVKLVKGGYCFFKGAYVTFKEEKVIKAFLSTLKIILFGVLASYLIIFFMSFPIRLFVSFLTWIGISHLESIDQMLDTKQVIDDIAYFIPLVVVGTLRYVVPSFNEDMFLFVLESQDKKLYSYLKECKILKTYPMIGYLKRFLKLAVMGTIVMIFGYIPYIGDFVLAVAQFYYSYRPLGQGTAFILSLFSLYGPTKGIAANVLKTSMAANSLGKELLEVYFMKLPDYKQELYIYRRFYGWIFGFSMLWTTVLRFPFVGAIFWGIAQGSTGFLILKLLQRNKLKYDNNETQVILLGQDQLSDFKEDSSSPLLTSKKLNLKSKVN
ncbi:hypothetical protein ACTA71_011718 [Dictyostelium dimigraforme]